MDVSSLSLTGGYTQGGKLSDDPSKSTRLPNTHLEQRERTHDLLERVLVGQLARHVAQCPRVLRLPHTHTVLGGRPVRLTYQSLSKRQE